MVCPQCKASLEWKGFYFLLLFIAVAVASMGSHALKSAGYGWGYRILGGAGVSLIVFWLALVLLPSLRVKSTGLNLHK
jgi:hypothetical protein